MFNIHYRGNKPGGQPRKGEKNVKIPIHNTEMRFRFSLFKKLFWKKWKIGRRADTQAD